MAFSLQVAGKTDVGRARSNNEDNFGYDLQHGVFLVCDGMGGQAAGEVASKLAVQAVLEFFRSGSTSVGKPPRELVEEAVIKANAAVREEEGRTAEHTGMGTTIVALLMRDGAAYIGHVGDSRAYLARGTTLYLLTEDHSWAAEQVKRGVISAEQAQSSPWQNVLLRALGATDEIEVDSNQMQCEPGDVFLLCSDGLMKMLNDQQIANIVLLAPDVYTACDQLIDAANAAGGEDNVTCVLVRVQAEGAVAEQPQTQGPL